MSSLAEAIGVRKRFGVFEAVKGVNLRVDGGEIVGLLGANGAGKTTLMRCLLGILAPSAGETRLFGGPPTRTTRARLGYVPQGMGLYRDLTVRENAEFAASAYRSGAALPGDRRLVERVPLGQQRLIAFRQAVGHEPELLILDEPTSGMGAAESARLWDAIGTQAQAGVGVLVTTHNMAEAAQCDRLILMVDGSVAGEGSMDDILAGATVVAVRATDWREAFRRVAEAGLRVSLAGREVRVIGANLAQVSGALGDLASSTVPVPATLAERMVMLQ